MTTAEPIGRGDLGDRAAGIGQPHGSGADEANAFRGGAGEDSGCPEDPMGIGGFPDQFFAYVASEIFPEDEHVFENLKLVREGTKQRVERAELGLGISRWRPAKVTIWRVSWKIQTALGTVLTDPDQPLIFGPAVVSHYPPVGTHFHSSTGKVKLVLEDSGRQIGHLIPGELTAFDIVVTKGR